jgi:hypothetical protein
MPLPPVDNAGDRVTFVALKFFQFHRRYPLKLETPESSTKSTPNAIKVRIENTRLPAKVQNHREE